MPTIGPMIAASARLGLAYAERLFRDVRADQFARFARIGDTVIESNHPAFVCGHLCLYPSQIVTGIRGDGSSFSPPASYKQLFSKDAKCVDDPEGTIYPSRDELVNNLLDGYRAAATALESAEDDVFSDANPNVPMRERFPTKGAMYAFYVGGHFMVHMGQLSAWRRGMGLGPA